MAIRFRVKGALARSTSNIIVATGATFVVFSAAPFPWLVYLGWFCLVAVAWLVASRETRLRHLILALLLLGSLSMALVEYPRRLPQRIDAAKCDRLFVIGDSLSMGADPPGKNWPELLGETIGLPTKNMSFGGAMLDTALTNAGRVDSENPLVILELGGNDLLRARRDFEQNLERLLEAVCRPGRRVAMLELPLPPFFNAYGMAQRKLARMHGVTLIPKRYLAATLAAPGATVDGLHLSNAGHELLGKQLRDLIVAPSTGG
jgi:acyl-CoA thioesterase-1